MFSGLMRRIEMWEEEVVATHSTNLSPSSDSATGYRLLSSLLLLHL